MFQEFSTPTWLVAMPLVGAFLMIIVPLGLLGFLACTKKEVKDRPAAIATFGVMALGFAMFLTGVLMDPGSRLDVLGEEHDNPNDVVELTYWQMMRGESIRTNVEALEATLMENTSADKLDLPRQSELRFNDLQNGEFKTFTGVDYEGANGEPVSVSGLFYYTDDTLVIITDVDSEHQETVTIPTD